MVGGQKNAYALKHCILCMSSYKIQGLQYLPSQFFTARVTMWPWNSSAIKVAQQMLPFLFIIIHIYVVIHNLNSFIVSNLAIQLNNTMTSSTSSKNCALTKFLGILSIVFFIISHLVFIILSFSFFFVS